MNGPRKTLKFQQMVVDELIQKANTILPALLAILLTTQLVRLQKEAMIDALPPSGVLVLVGFSAARYLSILLTITLFIAVLFTVGRQHRDHEVTIWAVNGMSLTAWVRPVLTFSLPIIVAIGILSGFIAPWASEQTQVYRQQLRAKMEMDTGYLSPGIFRKFSNDMVVYVESIDSDQVLHKIFAYGTSRSGREIIAIMDSGSQAKDENGRTRLDLGAGYWYERGPKQTNYSQMEFQGLKMDPGDGRVETFIRTVKDLPLLEVLGDSDSTAQGELLWRLSIPFAALNLVLLAIPLSYTNPRGGQTVSMVMAVLVYLVYSNLINIASNWVGQGRVSLPIAWLSVHGLVGLFVLGYFYRQIYQPRPWGTMWLWCKKKLAKDK